MSKTPSLDALATAAEWLEHADYDQKEMSEVADWLRKKAEDVMLREIAKHHGKSISATREMLKRHAKQHNVSEGHLIRSYYKKLPDSQVG